jgi:hypothetical protein
LAMDPLPILKPLNLVQLPLEDPFPLVALPPSTIKAAPLRLGLASCHLAALFLWAHSQWAEWLRWAFSRLEVQCTEARDRWACQEGLSLSEDLCRSASHRICGPDLAESNAGALASSWSLTPRTR